MTDDPRRLLENLVRRQQVRGFVIHVAYGLALAAPFLTPMARVPAAAAAALLGALLLGWTRARAIDTTTIARHLNRNLPELEDSAELLAVSDPDRLPPLQRVQRARIARRLAEPASSSLPSRSLRDALLALAASTAVCVAATSLAPRLAAEPKAPGSSLATPDPAAVDAEMPALRSWRIAVRPPTYTELPERHVTDRLDVTAVAGSRLSWTVVTAPTVDATTLVFADGRRVPVAAASEGTLTLGRDSIYRLELETDGEVVHRSPSARLTALPDQPPDISLERPAAFTEVSGASPIPLTVVASDDHGLVAADLVITLARGAGEMVEFRERRQPLTLDADGQLRDFLDLASLGLERGSELYLYAEARDARTPDPNVGRSTTALVRWPGPGRAAVDLGGGIPVLAPGAQVRSQRQIIIDTERLLAEADGLTRDEVELRAHTIGLDQRALRMRYGVLLGDEFESGVPVDEEDESDDDHGDHGDDPNHDDHGESKHGVEDLLAGLVHDHDSAESNTFFADEVRTTLRRVLGSMWRAEGELRAVDPAAALPHERAALESLKSLQQRSRVYVNKVAFDTPPIDVAKTRLTGDTAAVRSRTLRPTRRPDAEGESITRALALLDRLVRGSSTALSAADYGALDAAALAVERRALSDRSLDLEGIDALWNLAELDQLGQLGGASALAPSALEAAQRALWRAAPPLRRQPEPPPAVGELFGRYRANLEARPR